MLPGRIPKGDAANDSAFPTGIALLRDPALNKGTAFTLPERNALGLRGLSRVREVSAHIATAVAKVVHDRGLATKPQPNDLFSYVGEQMYDPHYRSYV